MGVDDAFVLANRRDVSRGVAKGAEGHIEYSQSRPKWSNKMGYEYSVCLDLAVKNEAELIELSYLFFSQEVPHLQAEWERLRTVDDVSGFMIAQHNQPENFSVQRYDGGSIYHNCFKATYSWYTFLDKWFQEVANILGDDSALLIGGVCDLERYIRNGMIESDHSVSMEDL